MMIVGKRGGKILFLGYWYQWIPKKSIDLTSQTIYFTYVSSCTALLDDLRDSRGQPTRFLLARRVWLASLFHAKALAALNRMRETGRKISRFVPVEEWFCLRDLAASSCCR
ncbi:hypothetical protein [Edaphobacter dinghuensis]|uniref:hypothetical protein n=1 Tax=Edaphobacter dinghuensis TaxID=1560005 RepID=UPI0016690E2D|nr:hypothetical protein [Edaphobacter dinghuensis]